MLAPATPQNGRQITRLPPIQPQSTHEHEVIVAESNQDLSHTLIQSHSAQFRQQSQFIQELRFKS